MSEEECNEMGQEKLDNSSQSTKTLEKVNQASLIANSNSNNEKRATNEKTLSSSLAKALGVSLPPESQLKNASQAHMDSPHENFKTTAELQSLQNSKEAIDLTDDKTEINRNNISQDPTTTESKQKAPQVQSNLHEENLKQNKSSSEKVDEDKYPPEVRARINEYLKSQEAEIKKSLQP